MAEAIARRNVKSLSGPKTLVAALYAGAFGVGLLPYALMVKSWPVWIILVAVVTAAFVGTTWSQDQYGGESPSYPEIAFALLGRCAAGATIGFFGIGTDYGVSGIIGLLFTFNSETAVSWGFYSSAVLTIFFAGATAARDAPDVVAALYPDRPGQRSPYFAIANEASGQWRLVMRVAAIIFGFAVTLIIMSIGSLAAYTTALLALTMLLAFVGAGYLEVKTIDSAHGTPPSAIAAVTALLEAAQYKVIPHPRTGDADADSVISVLDFLAMRSDDSMAGRIRAQTSRPGGDVRYEAAMLEPAVWVLEDQLRKQQSAKINLKPVLLVLGEDASISNDASSSATSAGKSVRIVRGPSEAELAAMVAAEDKGPLKSIAQSLFGTSRRRAS